MRFTLIVSTGCLLAAACAPAPRLETTRGTAVDTAVVEVVQRDAATRGDLRTFVPAVAATGEGGECEIVQDPSESEPLYVLSFPDVGAVSRNVSVRFDSGGQPVHYSDLRGDLQRNGTGPRSAVLLNFRTGTVHAYNRLPGRPHEAAEGPILDALAAPRLGNPQRMIDLIRTRCVKR